MTWHKYKPTPSLSLNVSRPLSGSFLFLFPVFIFHSLSFYSFSILYWPLEPTWVNQTPDWLFELHWLLSRSRT